MDTLGLLLAVVVTAANVQDRAGAESLLACLQHKFSRLRCIWADQAYTGDLSKPRQNSRDVYGWLCRPYAEA